MGMSTSNHKREYFNSKWGNGNVLLRATRDKEGKQGNSVLAPTFRKLGS